jgi:hypothetical protein
VISCQKKLSFLLITKHGNLLASKLSWLAPTLRGSLGRITILGWSGPCADSSHGRQVLRPKFGSLISRIGAFVALLGLSIILCEDIYFFLYHFFIFFSSLFLSSCLTFSISLISTERNSLSWIWGCLLLFVGILLHILCFLLDFWWASFYTLRRFYFSANYKGWIQMLKIYIRSSWGY